MKRLAIAFATIMMLVTAGSAQSASFIIADVPFSFHVQNNHASAGTYRISYQGTCKEYLAITDGDGAGMIAGLTFPQAQTDGNTAPKLVFHKYDDEYFLVAIRMPNHELWNVPEGQRELVSHRIVGSKVKPQEVTLTARLNK